MRRFPTLIAASIAASLTVPLLALDPASAAEPAGAVVVAASTIVSTADAASTGECTVTGGELTWGFKESFRAYISGTIANGTWTEIAPATYTTPDFGWPATGGDYDPSTGVGEVNFSGGIEFTGHDGLLDTTIANPTLVFAADGTAQLLLDISGLSMDDALAGNTTNVQTVAQTPFVSLDVVSVPVTTAGDVISGTAVPTAITAEGFEAFGNYEAGTAFDPVTFTVQLECAVAEETATPEPTTEAIVPISAAEEQSLPWLPGVVVVGVLVIGVVTLTVVAVRRRGRTGGPRGSGDAQ